MTEENGGVINKKKMKNKTFQCSGFGNCRMQFSRSEHLARHIRKHTGERPFKCYCGRTFSRLDNLRQHAQTIHTNEVIHSPYTLSNNSLYSSLTPKISSSSSPLSNESHSSSSSLLSNHKSYMKSKKNSVHLSCENLSSRSKDDNSSELSKFQSFFPNYTQSSQCYTPDHYNTIKPFSSPLFFHSSTQNTLLSKTDPTSNFSIPNNLGSKNFFPSNINSPLPDKYQNTHSFSQENHINTTNQILKDPSYSASSSTSNSLDTNKLPSITILMDCDLQRPNILSLSDKNEHTSIPDLKHDTQKMSIQFLCNQNITMGGINILAEVAKIIN